MVAIDYSTYYTDAHARRQVAAAHAHGAQAQADGHWLARLVQSNPRIARTFADHEAVARKLEEASEADTLVLIASSGVIDSTASRCYRQALNRLMAR